MPRGTRDVSGSRAGPAPGARGLCRLAPSKLPSQENLRVILSESFSLRRVILRTFLSESSQQASSSPDSLSACTGPISDGPAPPCSHRPPPRHRSPAPPYVHSRVPPPRSSSRPSSARICTSTSRPRPSHLLRPPFLRRRPQDKTITPRRNRRRRGRADMWGGVELRGTRRSVRPLRTTAAQTSKRAGTLRG